MGHWGEIAGQLQAGYPCVLVSVLDVKGSVPREAGARMVVRHDGTFSGTVGGGQLEWQAMALSKRLLASPEGHAFCRREFSLGPNLGQCCGGSALVGFETIPPGRLDEAQRLDRLEQAGSLRCLVTVEGGGLVRHVLPQNPDSQPMGETGRNAGPKDQFIEDYGPANRRLYLFGAGHVGRALMLVLATLPFDVTWIDGRANQFPKAVPGNFRCVAQDGPGGVLDESPAGSFVLIMTHSHALDLEITRAALTDGRFGYVGLIGSATKRARFKKRLRAAGLSEEKVDALVCPIGIEGIRSKRPADIALSTGAQMLVLNESLTTGNAAAGRQST